MQLRNCCIFMTPQIGSSFKKKKLKAMKYAEWDSTSNKIKKQHFSL